MGRALFLLAALLAVPAHGWAESGSLTLVISGTPGVAFSGSCKIMTDAGTRSVRLAGTVPRNYDLRGPSATCRIRQTGQGGRLTVELRKAGVPISRSTTVGGAAELTISVQ